VKAWRRFRTSAVCEHVSILAVRQSAFSETPRISTR
jgi:hypothetical protein